MNNHFRIVVIVLAILTIGPYQNTRAEELVTDRPDATESSSTVAPGFVQVEAGLTYFENDDEGHSGYGVPETLLRIGLEEDLELRLGWAGYVWERNSVGGTLEEAEGTGDPEVGVKLKLREESDLMPEAAFLTHVTLPVGQNPISSERPDPSYRFAFSHTLNSTLSLGYNIGQAWVTEVDATGDRDTRSIIQYTAALGIGLTESVGGYVEFYGDIPTGSEGGAAHLLNGGFTRLLSDNVQMDVSAGVGLSAAAEDWFIGTGLSFRLPN